MKIIKVRSKREMRAFVCLPKKIFKDQPNYVPPLWMDERKGYTAKNNPLLAISDFELFLVIDDLDQPIGRVIAYIDPSFNRHYQSNTGFFGAFDCIDNQEAASLLIRTAENWLLERGCDTIRGPINPVAESWGFVLDGYERDPVYLSPWNPTYYHSFFTAASYGKGSDLLVYEADANRGYLLPDRYDGFSQRFYERFPDVSIRRLDLKRIKKDARSIWEISNIALADNWGYVPLDLAVMEDMLRRLKLIVDPDAVLIAEAGGQAIGFCLGFPDINIILKAIHGHLLPFGWIRFLTGVKKLRDYRLFGLAVHPDWQGRALDAMLYINLYRNLSAKKIRMEANYILEGNTRIKNSIEKLDMIQIKTYRVYEKSLL